MKGAALIFKKEILELSKDKRTLFFTFLLPILLYPLMFFIIAGLGQNDAAKRMSKPSVVAVQDPAMVLVPALRAEPRLFLESGRLQGDLRQALKNRIVDLVIEVEPEAAEKLKAQQTYTIKAVLDATEPSSALALRRLKEVVKNLDKDRVAARLKALNASVQLVEPSRIMAVDAANPGMETGKALGSFLPYVLMLMMFQGAMQHGIYATAGEKERGTLQSLLATSLPRSQIIWGKLAYIFCMGLIAAILNLLSMGVSLAVALGQSAGPQGSAAPVAAPDLAAMTHPGILLLSFLLLVPLGLLFTSFILFMGIRARTTAEAGTSLMPGLFVIMILGAFSLAPGIERMAFLPYVPILNVSLVIRKLFSQQANAVEYLIAFLMTAGLSVLMTRASTRQLDREAVIFRQG